MIHNAVVPVAGLGTRLLPITKAVPKELLPVGRKPVVQHVVEELHEASIRNVLFVSSERKDAIETFLNSDDALFRQLEAACKKHLLSQVNFDRLGMQFSYIMQPEQLGLGHAITFAERFAEGKPFAVSLGDTIVETQGNSGFLGSLVEIFEQTGASCVIAVEEVPRNEVERYGIVKPSGDSRDGVLHLADIVEKPHAADAPSNLAVAARYVFSPDIFDALSRTTPGKGGEIQLTDAIRILIHEGGKVYAVPMPPDVRRYDIGTWKSYSRCFVDYALADEEFGESFREYLIQILAASKPRPDAEVERILKQ